MAVRQLSTLDCEPPHPAAVAAAAAAAKVRILISHSWPSPPLLRLHPAAVAAAAAAAKVRLLLQGTGRLPPRLNAAPRLTVAAAPGCCSRRRRRCQGARCDGLRLTWVGRCLDGTLAYNHNSSCPRCRFACSKHNSLLIDRCPHADDGGAAARGQRRGGAAGHKGGGQRGTARRLKPRVPAHGAGRGAARRQVRSRFGFSSVCTWRRGKAGSSTAGTFCSSLCTLLRANNMCGGIFEATLGEMHWSLRMESPAIVSGLEEGMPNRSCSAPQLHAVRRRRSTSLSGFGEKPYKTPSDSRRCTLCDGGAAHHIWYEKENPEALSNIL